MRWMGHSCYWPQIEPELSELVQPVTLLWMRTEENLPIYTLILIPPPSSPPPTEICPPVWVLSRVVFGSSFGFLLPEYFFTCSLVPILCISYPGGPPRSGSLKNTKLPLCLPSLLHTYSLCSLLLLTTAFH